MATPAFGFSVGDFIAGIKLAIKVYQACKETDKAAAERQFALEEMDAYLFVLQTIQDSPEIVTPDMDRHISACRLAVRDFCTKIEKEWECPSNSSNSSSAISNFPVCIKAAYRRSHWALSGTEAVDKFRQRIGPKFTALGLLINVQSRFE